MFKCFRWQRQCVRENHDVSLNEIQFGFVSERSMTDATFLVRQLQEEYLAENKPLYLTLVVMENVFDKVSHILV